MKLTWKRQEQARAYIFQCARPLERALYEYHFESGTQEAVLAQLATYQNVDGGFGHALEPDLRAAASSAIATTVALQILRELQVTAGNPLVQGAIQYLLATYDPEHLRWPIISAESGAAPYAPWWEYDAGLSQRFGEFRANPTAEIVGYLYDYAELVPKELLETLVQASLTHLERSPDVIEMHDLLCYIRLAETKTLPAALRKRMMQKLSRAVSATVARERTAWEDYGLPPLSIVSTPASPFASMFAQELEANLDYAIEQQRDDGSWGPNWSWGDAFPEAWASAERDWQGALTLATLNKLRAFGRLESLEAKAALS